MVLDARPRGLISTPNHPDRVLGVLRLDEFLPCSKHFVQVLNRDRALESTAERGIDLDGIGKAVFSADCICMYRFLHGLHSLAIRRGMPSSIHGHPTPQTALAHRGRRGWPDDWLDGLALSRGEKQTLRAYILTLEPGAKNEIPAHLQMKSWEAIANV